jgi:hypothetical protein
LIGLAPGTAEARKLPVGDECTGDQSFAAFRSQLRSAIAAKDSKRLLALTADDIEWSFGGDTGKKSFARNWALGRPASSPLWKELSEALRLGCANTDGYFASPYLFARFPEHLDGFSHVVAIAPGAAAHAAPAAQSRKLAALDGDILKLQGEDPCESGPWCAVVLPNGRKAWVRSHQVRSPLGYRAIFQKRKGRWSMTAFIAGD